MALPLANAQSLEASAPTPITARDLSASIAARDIGDSRFTRHYYTFSGNPGDVLITLQSKNLNGDVDIFTAGTLRPLLKFTLYAESSAPITKGIYLRRHEDLILRVEARSPNDDIGTYEIRFGGTFEPRAAPLVAEGEKPEPTIDLSARVGKTGRRVTSAGARINEPPPSPEEVAAVTPTPTPSPEATPAERPEPTPARATPSRRGRGRTPARRTTPPQPDVTAADKKETTPAEVKEPEKVATAEPEPARTGRRSGRRGARAPVTTPPVMPEPPSGPRLVLEMLDGTRTERFMSTIRRVTIENNQIVVTGKDGKIDRTRLSEVLRMTIEP
ncbi:MAG TPA: hypothetical protein VFH15_12485 [Pyrinomonadaceae bacterium]|nr:hypothetical protein [Pyrinomonadaceae bacterium]